MTGKAKPTWLRILNIILSDILEMNPSVLQMVSVNGFLEKLTQRLNLDLSLWYICGYICGRKREEAG